MKIGIDFSLNSPAVTIKNDNGTYEFISFFNFDNRDWNMRILQDKIPMSFGLHKELMLSKTIHIFPYNRNVKSKLFQEREREKMTDANMISDLIIDALKKHIKSNDINIGLEGFSYGSSGNSFIDIIQYNTYLRYKLLTEFGIDNVSFYQPSHVKKLAGKGNANKFFMVKAFQDNVLNDKDLKQTKLWNYVKDKDYSKKIPKPLDDIIDSYFILNCNID